MFVETLLQMTLAITITALIALTTGCAITYAVLKKQINTLTDNVGKEQMRANAAENRSEEHTSELQSQR